MSKPMYGQLSETYVSGEMVYGVDMRTKRHALMVGIRIIDETEWKEHYVCGVRARIEEPWLAAELEWVVAPNKGLYHRTERKED